MNETPIPFNRPSLAGNELANIAAAIAGGHVSGDGPFTRRCHAVLEEVTGAKRALLTTSGTHALEMAALLLNITPGDEVIVPSFTFVSTANAFVLRGGRPVFVDIRPDTLNLDESLLERSITPRTKAIVVVHYAGVGCEMDAIQALAARRRIPIVEDNAHGLFGRYRGTPLGSFGCLAAQSFHETKNVSCGEGGALLINDAALVEQAEIVREKGTNRSRFFRGEIDKYSWVGIGSSYLPSDLLAAFLLAQLEARDDIQKARCRIWNTYHARLASWAEARDVRLPIVPDHCEQPYHMFYLLLGSLADRESLRLHLLRRRITSVFHYLPLHVSDMGRRFGGSPGDCPVAEQASDRLLRLPFYNDFSEGEQARVIDTVTAWSPQRT